jgi:hypothetical protein
MKRLTLMFLSFMMVLTMALAACTPSEPLADVSPTQPAADSETVTDEELAALPELPGMDTAAGGFGGGGGGGIGMGGGGDADVANAESLSMIRDWEPVNVFSGTQFIANVTFPSELGPSLVLEQQPWTMDVATARMIADQWGFTGPLFLIPQPPAPAGEPAITYPTTYFVFDGKRTLQLDSQYIYYYDGNLNYEQASPIAYEQAKAIAEGYLQARGLLNFSYEVRQGYVPSEVYFHRLVDGRPVNQPEIWVSMIGDQIGTIGYSVLRAPAELGNYPLMSAEQAWQQLIENATVAGNVLYEMMPAEGFAPETFVEEPAIDQPMYWPRVYQAGQEAHLYTWPTIYVSAEGNAAPRIETYPLALQASDETLQAIAASGSRMFHIWGTVAADGKTLEVAGFEALDENVNYSVFVEGTIGREGDQVVVTAFETGESYILPNAPADVPDGLEVSVFGYASRDTGLTHPVLEWDNISERIIYEEQPVIDEPVTTMPVDIWEPYLYQNVTVDKIELAYYYTYVQDQEAIERGEYAPATIMLQPVWKFSGTAENGDQLTFYIQAVAARHIQQ